jgi:hypothetical protein
MKTSARTLALIASFPLSAGAQTLRCGETLISEGITQAEVAARCGQPTLIDHQTIYSEGAAALPGGPPPGDWVGLSLPGVVRRSGSEIPVEVWTYNFGPDRFMQRIRFENGVVVKVESLGYGF